AVVGARFCSVAGRRLLGFPRLATFTPLATLRAVAAFRTVTAALPPGWLRTDLFGDVGAGLLVDDAHRQLHLAPLVEADDLHLHRVAVVDHVRGPADAALRQLADVYQTVTRAEEVYECAEIGGLHHLSGVDHANFRLRDD